MKEVLSSIKELEAVRARQIESHMALMDNLEKQKKNLQDNLLANCGLNEQSVVGLISTLMHYFNVKDMNLHELLNNSIVNNSIDYRISDNLIKDEH
jgi:hypothetical protein